MKSIESFKKELSNLFSLHCDACVGFEEVVKSMSRIKLPEKLEGKNSNGEPNHLITYGVGSIEDGNRKNFSVRTQEEMINMNHPGSTNEQTLGAMLVTSLFALWEERFRKEIGEELGEHALQVPIFGDIRLLRNCIVHHSGTWQPSLKRLEVLTIPENLVENEGGVVRLTKSRILDVWWGVHLALDDLLERKQN